MTRLLMLVEGQSEEIFVNQTLKPFLEKRGIYVEPILLWTKRTRSGGGFRGGVSNWEQIRKSLIPLTYDSAAWITMLLDFYGLPDDFPGFSETRTGNALDAVLKLEKKLSEEVGNSKFIPFFALHEFEAWLFCSPDVVADHFGHASVATKIRKAVQEAGEPERINHGETTHPKARLQGMGVGYKETSDGPTLMGKIGIPTIRNACPHFSDWLGRLEAIGQQI